MRAGHAKLVAAALVTAIAACFLFVASLALKKEERVHFRTTASPKATQSPSTRFEPGTPVATFLLPDLRGRHVALPKAGRPTLVHYWATWCGPCLKEMPILDAYARKHPATGPAMFGIAQDQPEDVEHYLRDKPLAFPVLLDVPAADRANPSIALGNDKGIIPYAVLFDGKGRLQAQHSGPFRDTAELESWIARAESH
jgi:thiol-disulfide isomerase/thioredoxin